MNGRVVHIADDGTRTDVTEGVRAAYDLVISSMDFGSGFLSFEDAVPLVRLARLCGFEQAEAAERYVKSVYEAQFRDDALRAAARQRHPDLADWLEVPHEHVFAREEPGALCIWRHCGARKEDAR